MKRIAALAGLAVLSGAWAGDLQAERLRNTKQPTGRVAVQPIALDRVIVVAENPLVVAGSGASSIGPGWWLIPGGRVAEWAGRPGVSAVYQDAIVRQTKDQFVPNDPFYAPNQPAAPWPGQWYLNNTFVNGRDLRVVPAWNRNITGLGVVVGVIDDGFEFTHPDLTNTYTSANSFDFLGNDTNVFPGTANDVHGTALAGLISARGGNGQGVTGVAPFSAWSGQRVDVESGTVSQLVNATLHRSSGANTQIKIKNHSYGILSPWVDASAQAGAMVTSSASGTIHIRSAGNLRGSSGEDVNKFTERATPVAITVAAMGSDGLFANYSNFGAAVMCTAPSTTTSVGGLVVLTTDRVGETNGFNGGGDTFPNSDYASTMTGTSVSAALASGVMALTKQVQPNLDTRFAKHLIARTSTVVHSTDASDSSDGGWRTNGAGLRFNQNYGFGLLNADVLTLEAPLWAGPSALETTSIPTTSVATAIPDNTTTGLTRTFAVTSTTPLEEVQVTLNATHTYRGDLEAFLINPAGQASRLLIRAGTDDGDNLNWTFTTNAFWGENPAGTWTIRLRDTAAVDTGTWTNFAVSLRHGQLRRQLSGQVVLNSFSPGPTGQLVNLRFEPVGGGTTFSRSVTLDSNGNFTLPYTFGGTYDIYAEKRPWLIRKIANVNTTQATVSGLTWSMINGDVNGDNEVGAADFSTLAAAYDAVVGDPNFDPFADLNGDEEVGAADFSILAASYDEVGD